MATAGSVDLILDVRTQDEWNSGHIENATFAENLGPQLSNTNDKQSVLQDLGIWGCRTCRVIAYCRSGARAGEALGLLVEAGFRGELYNGLGINDWRQAGYDLVEDDSVESACACLLGNTLGGSSTATITIQDDADITLTNTATGETIDMNPNNQPDANLDEDATEEEPSSSAAASLGKLWTFFGAALAVIL